MNESCLGFFLVCMITQYNILVVSFSVSPFLFLLCTLSYKILAPQASAKADNDHKVAEVILETVNLDADQFRLGHTKAIQFSFKRLLLAFKATVSSVDAVVLSRRFVCCCIFSHAS